MSKRFRCQICSEPKHKLFPHKSTISNSELIACQTCIDTKKEPRYLLVIAYATGGKLREKAEKVIKSRRYEGDAILLDEVL